MNIRRIERRCHRTLTVLTENERKGTEMKFASIFAAYDYAFYFYLSMRVRAIFAVKNPTAA